MNPCDPPCEGSWNHTFKVITQLPGELGEQRLELLAMNTTQKVESSLWLVWMRTSQSGLFQLQVTDVQLKLAHVRTK